MVNRIIDIAVAAGDAILPFYGNVGQVTAKADESPLTAADQASHKLIVCKLEELTPDIPVISEESEDLTHLPQTKQFWLVDPLDGTKEFLKKTAEFTVNIALIDGDEPILGVVYVPAQKALYYAERGGKAFFRKAGAIPQEIRIAPADVNKLRVVASKDHAGPEVGKMLEKIPNAELKSMGSSLKFCLVAAGEADFYPRFVPTMEWDTAAAHCIVVAAGGEIFDLAGKKLRYRKEGWRNPSIITFGDKALFDFRCMPWKQ